MAKRIYLRIPVSFPGQALFPDGTEKEVRLDELSSTGLSFCLNNSEQVPDYFMLQFRFTPISKLIKVKAEVKNRNAVGENIRIGCMFLEISEEDKELITKYLWRFGDLSLSLRLVAAAALFCLFDAVCRITAYFLYSAAIKFDAVTSVSLKDSLYLCILIIYSLCASTAFVFKKQISAAIFWLMPASIFVIVKIISYFKLGIWHSGYLWVNMLFWAYLIFAFYITFCITAVVTAIKEANLTSDILNAHIAPKVIAFILSIGLLLSHQAVFANDNIQDCIVTGIFYDQQRPTVMIGANIYPIGSVLPSGTIMKISPQAIIINSVAGQAEYRVGDSVCQKITQGEAETRGSLGKIDYLVNDFMHKFEANKETPAINSEMTELIKDYRQQLLKLSMPHNRRYYLAIKIFDIGKDAWLALIRKERMRAKILLNRLSRVNQEFAKE